ncbi:MAG: hypothetical protein RBU29_09035 [bacterium]|jgi:hypothetical protein|nr:hypothetical protein [bacterium]
MKKPILIMVLLMGSGLLALAQPVHVNLSSHFDTDVFLQPGGAALTEPLDEDGRYMDAVSLPKSYQDGKAILAEDGRASFLFANLLQSSLDGVSLHGQKVDVTDGMYQSIDLAFLTADGMGSPFPVMQFNYTDGTSEAKRFGPISDWFHSPTGSDNVFYRYTDDSGVTNLVDFAPFSEDEAFYILGERGNGNSGGNRFIDGTGYILYVFDDIAGITQATLGVTVGNNFVISIATEFYDPETSTEEGFTVLANSMDLHDGYEHRSLGNLKQYTFDLAPFLAQGTGELYLLLTDATTGNGWGPYITHISVFQGEAKQFEETLEPSIDTTNATVHAMFQTDGSDAEKPYLYDNSGSGPSNRRHRFADAGGSITYRLDLPDGVDEANLTMDLANNFVVSLSGPTGQVRYDQVSPGTPEEKNYLVDDGGSILGNGYRFADGNSYMIYQFDLDDSITQAYAQISVGNQFIIEVAGGTGGDFEIEYDWVFDSGQETTDNSNLAVYPINLAPYLQNNPSKIIQIRLSDGIPTNGWGPYFTGCSIVNKLETGESQYVEVLNAMTMFGVDVHNEWNKRYYTVSLNSVLQNNPSKEVFVRLTDGSTGDGWGPGIFWMAAYTGTLDIQSDRYVFSNLLTTLGDPTYGAGFFQRNYALDPTKTLKDITLPENAEDVFLLAATLNPAGTAVADWMLQ